MSNTEAAPRSIKQRIHDGDRISHRKVPTNASREYVHEFVAEHAPDMIYLDAHHSPITEWDISRICRAGQEKDTPVMMRIKHANPAPLISSLLDIGVFSIKAPTVEDEATVDALIDAFYYPPVGKRSLGGANNYGEGAKKLGPDGSPYFEWWNSCSGPLELGTGLSNTRECCRPSERGYDDGETTIVQPAVQDRGGAGAVARSEDTGPDLSGARDWSRPALALA